ncbi:hypothetical protein ACVLVH_000514 [Kluyvera sp. 1366]
MRFPGWGSDDRLDVLHAWLIEDLSDNRVRILTQERWSNWQKRRRTR